MDGRTVVVEKPSELTADRPEKRTRGAWAAKWVAAGRTIGLAGVLSGGIAVIATASLLALQVQ